MPRVEGFLFDDDSVDKFATHGIGERQVDQVLDSDFVIVPNRKRRRALYLLVGRDLGGMCIAVPIEPTRDPGIWRPITAWPCKEQKRATLDHKRREP